MSRSIHETRRRLGELEVLEKADPGRHGEALEEAGRKLARKRRAKRQVREERRAAEAPRPAAPAPVEGIPIRIVDSGPFVHYPASPDDLRTVLRRLPQGMADGLAGIDLCLGKTAQDTDSEWDAGPAEVDPFVGRPGSEVLPGIWGGRVLGFYLPDRSRIVLHAYVGKFDAQPAERRGLVDLYLRLLTLETLVHEVAHHDDYRRRRARGRWRMDHREKCELYAEAVTHRWIEPVLLPYLIETYPGPTERLLHWVRRQAGVDVPLTVICGDPRHRFFSTERAIESLVGDAAHRVDPALLRAEFAYDLHFGREYDLALRILDRILAKHPRHLRAMTVEAHVLTHVQRWDEALDLAETALAIDPDCTDALDVAGDVFFEREDWSSLLDATGRHLRLIRARVRRPYGVMGQHIRAKIELGRFAAAAKDIERLAGWSDNPWNRRRVRWLRDRLAKRMREAGKQATGPRGRPPVRTRRPGGRPR